MGKIYFIYRKYINEISNTSGTFVKLPCYSDLIKSAWLDF